MSKKKSKDEEEIEDEEDGNSLEQTIEEEQDEIDISKLDSFLEKVEIQDVSPSLEKINAPQRVPMRLESGLGGSSFSNDSLEEEENSFNYNSGNKGRENSEDPKYIRSDGQMVGNIISGIEIENIGRENMFERREIGFQNSSQSNSKNSSVENFEKYSPMKKSEKENIGKGDLFKKEEIKYSPKGY